MANIAENIYFFSGNTEDLDKLQRLICKTEHTDDKCYEQRWLFKDLQVSEELTYANRENPYLLRVDTESRWVDKSEDWKALLQRENLNLDMAWQCFEPDLHVFYRVDPRNLFRNFWDVFTITRDNNLDSCHLWRTWRYKVAQQLRCIPRKNSVVHTFKRQNVYVLFCSTYMN